MTSIQATERREKAKGGGKICFHVIPVTRSGQFGDLTGGSEEIPM